VDEADEVRWVVHVTHMGKMKEVYKLRDYLGDIDVNGSIILIWT
jgi:hypothetical protein